MLGIVYATLREAEPFLRRVSAEPLTGQPLPLFRAAAAGQAASMVVVSGMGKVAATLAASHLVLTQRVSVLLNAGLCGRLNRDGGRRIGDLLRISSAVEGDCDRFGQAEPAVACDPGWFSHLASARLVTSDRPVFESAWRDRLAPVAELADMEGAAVARVAQCYGIPCAMIKGISDGADESGRLDVARHIDPVATCIADALVHELTTHSTDRNP